MEEKVLNILKFIIIFVIIIGILIFKYIPEYKESQGSSDTFIDTNVYQDIIEIKVNAKPNFAIITKETAITNILFFDKESLCLYNQDIENSDIQTGIKQIVRLLIENDYLKQNATITITRYKGPAYDKVKQSLEQELANLSVVVNYLETSTTIEQKGKELSTTSTDENSILKEIELYSKDIVRNSKNNVSQEEYIPPSIEVTEDTSREYTDTVYKKIEVYVKKNNIINQEVSNMSLPITLIPADKNGTIYPDNTSWYYIKDSKVYAYISITQDNENYSYCYQASIDEYKKGQC